MRRLLLCAVAIVCSLSTGKPARAADHSDVPILGSIGRPDAQITDLFAFTNGDNLVLILCTNPAIPPDLTDYLFPSDLTITFFLNHHSKVRFDDSADLLQFGGTIENPASVVADASITITFDDDGAPHVKAKGLKGNAKKNLQWFAGLTDDPFIRRPREGKNVASVVVELPLEAAARNSETLLVWGTTQIPGPDGPLGDHAGRALRSMFDEPLNALSPQEQFLVLGAVPDVVIFDTAYPAAFPNGRSLTDDVVDLVVDLPAPLPGEDPTYPTTNDVPFLTSFPYLAAPH